MPTILAQLAVVEDAQQTLGLTRKQVAQVIRANDSTVSRWLSGDTEPSPVFLARLQALEAFLNELKSTLQPGYMRPWLITPMPAVNDRTPLDLLLEGRVEMLTGILVALNSGMSL